MTSRRTFVKGIGSVITIGAIAGCSQETDDGSNGGGNVTTAEPNEKDWGNGTVDFNVSPSVAQESLKEQYEPIKKHLSNEVGAPAKMNLANNYSAVIQALGSGTSDVAETGPFAAALGVRAGKAEIILQRKGYGSWTYVSGIATSPDSNISSLSDLEGKKVGFADRLSTSGALYPVHNIKTEGGLDVGELPAGAGSSADFEPNFTGGHVSSYEALKAGQVDAAAMGGFVEGIADNWSANAEWVFKEEGLPRAPIVVSPALKEENKQAVIDAFTNAPDSIYYGEDGKEGTEDDLWFNGVRKKGVDEYQSVIDVAKDLGVGTDFFTKV